MHVHNRRRFSGVVEHMESNSTTIFRIYDYLTAMLTGFIAALLVFWLVSPEWPIVLCMIVGMVFGSVSLLTVFAGLGWIAGSFEIFMPGMFIGMIVGMTGGMWIKMGDPTMFILLIYGVFTGFVLSAIFHCYDRSLHGEQV